MTGARLSVSLPTYAAETPENWDYVLDVAQAADDAGVDRVVVSDHVVFGENLEAYANPETGGVEGGRQPTGPDGAWLEPLTVLTAVAARTSRVRLGTYILLAALRRPAVLAKQVATLDALSQGRVDLGVGIGWQREEYEAAGLDFGARGRLLDHSLAVCQTLWRETRADFDSPELHFEGIHQMPKPVQEGGVPLWISGRCNERVAQRIAQFGNRWIPWGDDAADPLASVPRMRAAIDAAGGDGSALTVLGTLPPPSKSNGSLDYGPSMDRAATLVGAGLTDFLVHVRAPRTYDGAHETFAPLVAAFREAAGE